MKKVFLGINFGHDAGITILDKNNIFTSLSERINFYKQSAEVNKLILSRALKQANVELTSIKHIAITSTQGRGIPYNENSIINPKKILSLLDDLVMFGDLERMFKNPKWHFLSKDKNWKLMKYPTKKCLLFENINESIENIRTINLDIKLLLSKISDEKTFSNKEIYFIDHHLAHCFDGIIKTDISNKTLIISLDGATHSFAKKLPITFAGLSVVFNNKKIKKINPSMFFGGAFYGLASQFVKLSEGKLMGLSSYAKSKLKEKDILGIIKNLERVDMQDYCRNILFPKLLDINLVEFRKESEYLTSFESRNLPDKKVIAFTASVQKIFELYYTSFIQKLIDSEKPKNMVIVGGCALNCPSNSLVINKNPKINITISNSCNDEGLSNGCVQFLNYFQNNLISYQINESPFLGEKINNYTNAINISKKNKMLKCYEDIDNKLTSEIILSQLLNNKFGILFRGSYEIGPRALCNRSLIARSDINKNHTIMNHIKSREQWRPLAPCTIKKYFNKYFDGPQNSYMLVTQYVKNNKIIPAVAHIDDSARCQLIESSDVLLNDIFTGLNNKNIPPVLINTSFNSKDEPIINDSLRALEFFLNFDDISFFLIENSLIIKI